MLQLYKSLIRCRAEYCSPLWSPTKTTDIQLIETVQRQFTRRIHGLGDMNYWDRLKELKLKSLQRRRERYSIIHIWKLLHGVCPNDIKMEFKEHPRLGFKVLLPTLNRQSSNAAKTCYDNSFAVRAGRLWNTLPKDVNTKKTLESFKAALEVFLETIPDMPPTPGYSTPNSNSIIDWCNQRGDWTAIRPAVDLEKTPLEIKTNSTLESGDYVAVLFYNSQGEDAGGVYIYFTSTPRYWLVRCSSNTTFPSNLPAAVDKVWRISLNKTSGIRLQIHCNDVEVLNTLLSDDTCHSYWRKYWSRDVEKIAFYRGDTASDYYRLYQQGNWTAVKPAVDLETTPLEIKTNSTLESGDEVEVYFYNSQGEDAGRVWIYFSSTPQYRLVWCSSDTNFPSNLPAAVDKVWRISLNKTSGIRLQIHCNDVEVLNTLLSDDTCSDSDWREYWSRDVEKIAFYRGDTASDYYRRFKPGCTGLKAAWTGTMTTTAKFPVDPGTVVEVTCSDPGTFNNGSSQVTCVSGTEFTYRSEPHCTDFE
ncbi:hypothetical protein ACHWQZ_G005141 [Mnemiopsis leidyi]